MKTNLFALGIFLRGFTVSTCQRPLYWQRINNGYSTISDDVLNSTRFLLVFILAHGNDKHNRLLVQLVLNGLRRHRYELDAVNTIFSSCLCSGASNGSVSQNICSSGKVWLAGRFWKNDMSLYEKCCWEIDIEGCLRCFDLWSSRYVLFVRNLFALPPPPPHPLKGVNFALRPHPISYQPHPPTTTTTEGLNFAPWPHPNW